MKMQDEMAPHTTIKLVREGAVDWLTLNRPERMNALKGVTVRELWRYFGELQGDYACRIVVINGAGAAFCAGLDLKSKDDTQPSAPALAGPPRGLALRRGAADAVLPPGHRLAGAWGGLRGGVILALAFDIRIAGESAKMNVAFVKLGLSGCGSAVGRAICFGTPSNSSTAGSIAR